MSSSDSRALRLSRLNYYYKAIKTIILDRQHPVTGLIPASVAVTTHGDYRDAWVRDNVYSILAVYGLAQAYRSIDDDTGRAYALQHSVIKLMRGLLTSMMRQADKVEKFKHTQSKYDSLHAKYNTATGDTVVGDKDWGHLQIDATSIFLLMLAEMTASNYNIVQTYDEVDFIQNLVFYIEHAYQTPDYGIWERGNKSNHGEAELNSSSIGMAVAALEAVNGLNLFGSRGGPASVIHALPDEITRNYVTLTTQLPRESSSKETDSAILSVIGYPAFAVRSRDLRDITRNEILEKLRGRYGCRRFLRDGHQCVNEDTSRLYYNNRELKQFENVECEWPLFFTYLILEGLFTENFDQAKEYIEALNPLLIDSNTMNYYDPEDLPTDVYISESIQSHEHMPLIPELFYVPQNLLEAERAGPHSQDRKPNDNLPLVWASSLFFVGCLIRERLLEPAEIDPLGRRYNSLREKNRDNLVQIVLLSENSMLQEKLAAHGIETQTLDQVRPVTVLHPGALTDIYSILGQNTKLKLSGRPSKPMGTLSTCRLYRVQGKLYAFTPNFMDTLQYYLNSDSEYLVSSITNELQFTRLHWLDNGRPTMVLKLTENMFNHNYHANGHTSSTEDARGYSSSFGSRNRSLLKFIMALRSGVYAGMRVRLGRLSELIPTSHIECLDFLVNKDKNLWEKTLKLEDKRKGLSRSSSRLRFDDVCSINEDVDFTNNESFSTASINSQQRNSLRRRSTALTTPLCDLESKFSGDYFGKKPRAWKLLDHVDTPTPSSIEQDKAEKVRADLEKFDISASTDEIVNGNDEDDGGLVFTTSSSSDDDKEKTDGQETHQDGHQEPPTSTSPEPLALSLGDKSMMDVAINSLSVSTNIYDQLDLLFYIHTCVNDLEHYIERFEATLGELLSEIYIKAMDLGLWSVVRQVAGITQKMIPELEINITELIVRRIDVTVGLGQSEVHICRPQRTADLCNTMSIIFKEDLREGPLVQEIIKASGDLIRANHHIFDGIMCLRTHDIIIAMREEIMRLRGTDEVTAIEALMQLSPYQLKQLLLTVLGGPKLSSINTFTLVKEQMIATDIDYSEPLDTTPIDRNIKLSCPAHPFIQMSQDLPDLSTKDSWIIKVQSGGYLAGCFAHIILDDHKLPIHGRGLHVLSIDTNSRSIVDLASFDTHASKDESDSLALMINNLDPGMLVCIAALDEFCESLTPEAVKALSSLGSTKVRDAKYRDSWCMIGVKQDKNNPPESSDGTEVLESLSPSTEGPTTYIQYTLNFGEEGNTFSPKLKQHSSTIPSTIFVPPSHGRWLRRRKNDGALNRVPPKFYPHVWTLLERSGHGINLGNALLPADPLVFDQTAEEPNFAQIVEGFMDANISDPAEQQVVVLSLNILFHLVEKHSVEGGVGKGSIDPLKYISDALKLFWSDWVTKYTASTKENGDGDSTAQLKLEDHESLARNLFFDLQPSGTHGMIYYLGKAILGKSDKESIQHCDEWTERLVADLSQSESDLL
ncbi:hypothetical protein H4219_000361 [Mycoemilia scoparia]|uniref:Phosphorylase b kinase regulatory subunit n=1 Tax=Mycoemilia scoparia TaxID=417184 RepID=A0A9W8DX67_9FUNG|nr:hypothetical protein H4219_000361 [Mycoemilia scoparia]